MLYLLITTTFLSFIANSPLRCIVINRTFVFKKRNFIFLEIHFNNFCLTIISDFSFDLMALHFY